MRHLAFVSLVLSTAALTACKQENSGYCPDGDCIDASPDVMQRCTTEGPDDTCPDTAPVCAGGFCGPCTMDEQCTGRTGDVCGGGACVVCDEEGTQAAMPNGAEDECQAPGQQVCDATTQTCRACAVGTECASDVCDNGTCVPEAMVAYVEINGPGSDCTSASPCPKVSDAIATRRFYILVRPGAYSTNTEIDFDNAERTVYASGAEFTRSGMGVLVTVRGNSKVRIVGGTFDGDGDGPNSVITTTSATELTLVGTTIINGDRNGVLAQGDLTVHDAIVRDNQVGLAIDDSGNDLEVARSAISGNTQSAIRVTSARRVRLGNNIIYNNGLSGSVPAVQVSALSEPRMSTIQFNTIVDNVAGTNTMGAAISCPTDETEVRNSILWGNRGMSQVSICTVKYSTVQGATPNATDGVINDAPTFVPPPGPAYHLTSASVLREKADPLADLSGIFTSDFDREPRRQGGTRADLGADEVP